MAIPRPSGPGPHEVLPRDHPGRDPDAVFKNDETTGLATTYDPAPTYDAYKAFLAGNPDVQFIENVDIGAEHANRAIADAGLAGKVFTLGWNVSYGQLDGIEVGTQVVALDQKWSEQAGFGALACADFLANGIVRPSTTGPGALPGDQGERRRGAGRARQGAGRRGLT